MDEKQRKVGNVFSDYKTESNLKVAEVEGMDWQKKVNSLKICITASEYIEIKEIWFFEKFLIERFKFSHIETIIKYDESVKIKGIKEEWANLICYMTHKYPLMKPMLLLKSDVNIEENTINVAMHIRGADFLKARKLDLELQKVIKNIFGKEYKINIYEEMSEKELQQIKESNERTEKHVVELAMEKCTYVQEQDIEVKKPKEVSVKKSNSQDEKNSDEKKTKEVNAKVEEPKEKEPENDENSILILGRTPDIRENLVKVTDITADEGRVAIEGEIINGEIETKELKSGKFLLSFNVYDGTSTMTCKAFCKPEEVKSVTGKLKKAKGVKIGGNAGFSNFSNEIELVSNTIIETEGIKKQVRQDLADVKRVELHMHTKMSQMDAITSATDLIKRAMKWGMKSIAITDHGVVQAFPEAHKLLGRDNPDMKIIYGVEAYLAPDNSNTCVTDPKGQDIDTTYCVLDLETTGLSAVNDKITEVGIMKVVDGKVVDEFSCFVNPERPIPQRVVEVTNITDEMVKDAETIDKVFPKILEFVGDSVIVAHNAKFDVGFLKHNAKVLGLSLNNTYLDTLALAKNLFPNYKKYKLGKIAENLKIKVEVAHRALDDVDTTVKVFNVMINMLKERGAKKVQDIDVVSVDEASKKEEYKKLNTYHAIILAKNYVGLKNLYKLVSYSHLNYFYKKPRILKSLYKKYSEGLILGSACEAGELYRAILGGASDEEVEEIASDYDYLEIQPIGNNQFLVRNGTVPDEEALKDINRKIVELGEKMNKPVVATCDVHFMDPQDEIYRRILEAGQGYEDADMQAPLYLRTTNEMLEEFKYLGEEKAYEVVVTNTNKIADMCDRISPISPEKCPPHIPGCEDTIKEIA